MIHGSHIREDIAPEAPRASVGGPNTYQLPDTDAPFEIPGTGLIVRNGNGESCRVRVEDGVLVFDYQADVWRVVRADLGDRLEVRLAELHPNRNGYCNTCGGQFPCLTLRIVRGEA